MEPIWFSTVLSDELIKNDNYILETPNLVTDLLYRRIDITKVVENMAGVLTDKQPENREKGIRFFTKVLSELPNDFLTEMQLKFISKFYTDRLKDNHRVIPKVLEGYLALIDMKHYNIHFSGEYLNVLFREISCQSQVRQDRHNIYLTVEKLLDKDKEYIISLGPDFVFGFISAMDGERDPRNLLFLFNLLPKFLTHIPLGHLVEEMFEVVSCYYPIDFHPSPNDPAAVTRDELANALCPCLCASPEFGQLCLVLLVEKLDSTLRVAKLDSLRLLAASCKKFNVQSYIPFLKTLWSSLHREISQKTDDELKLASHEALSALVAKLATSVNTDQSFETFVKGIIISMQTAIAEAKTVAQFVQATKVLLTTGNSSKEACVIVTRLMIPAVVSYYEFKTSAKLQVASLEFLADLYGLAEHWEILSDLEIQLDEIPRLCLTAVSEPVKEYQIRGFKTLIKVVNALRADLVLPFIEVLIHIVKHGVDDDILTVSVETIHTIARKHPELIMDLVVRGKCNIESLVEEKTNLQTRLRLLSNLASIDDFTKVILEEMLKVIAINDENACVVVKELNYSLSNASLYTDKKVTEIESDHGLIDSVLSWLLKEIKTNSEDSLMHGFTLVSNTMCSLPSDKQLAIINRYSADLMEKCNNEEIYFPVLECLYRSLHQNAHSEYLDEVLKLSLKYALNGEKTLTRTCACCLIAHILNKADVGQRFELLYELLKGCLLLCNKEDANICDPLIQLFGWITKALIMRGSDHFIGWLQKILIALKQPECSRQASEAIRVIMTESPDNLNTKHHCRTSLLYKQRIFQSFSTSVEKLGPWESSKGNYLISWSYILEKAPKSVLNSEVNKITPLIIDSLCYDNKNLLVTMIDVLIHFVQAKHVSVAESLQTILPRLVHRSGYIESMDVRIKSLQCLYEIANNYKTVLLLPYKSDVIFGLAPSLDDKKRLVRDAAVRARTRWYLVGAPGEDTE
ncbi:MMS19 nucleotide excision repair protein homolog [Leptidea sinapis]|uniref:MMS19 nucleotide excision repair protein homolog n=1 Tax=Leptidea sinapis TaxID=189913 RepID=UPI0021C3F09E|nr:MMS19 nucleotide excision repair protein homolog [Leptidea sinapis]